MTETMTEPRTRRSGATARPATRTFWDAFRDSLADMFDFGQFFAPPRPRDDRPAREIDAEARQRDSEAIRGYWEAVGGYMWRALGQVEAEHPEISEGHYERHLEAIAKGAR